MIKSFKNKRLEHFFYLGTTQGIHANHIEKLADILDLLHAADTLNVMHFPGSRLHKLEPKKDNIWSVHVSGNWRVTFKYTDGDAYEVDYTDYH